ncbi:MAG: polymer-forming cytoskeletal protein [Anaerolineales bacterium]
MVFRRPGDRATESREVSERVDSILGSGVAWQGTLTGTGGIRIDGAFDGEIALRGLVVIGEQGRVTCKHIRAATVIVAGSVKGDITAGRVEIARTGRVWGDVITTSFSTEEGAFLRGKITMEEQVDLGLGPSAEDEPEADEADED